MRAAGSQRGQVSRQRGFALLIVLWTLVLLTLLATQLTSVGRSEARIADNLRTDAAKDAIASGAIYQAVFRLLDASGDHWHAGSPAHEWRQSGEVVSVAIESEAGKVNPNTASPALLEALLRRLGVDGRSAPNAAEEIVRWRSAEGQGPSDVDAYRRAGLDYRPPRAPFRSVDEVALVLGMTPELFARLRPLLSVYETGPIDPRLAEETVRSAMHDAGEETRAPAASPPIPWVVLIRATVGTGDGRVVRQARFRLDASGAIPPFKLLTWDE
jgi:general secretion pathway protein K